MSSPRPTTTAPDGRHTGRKVAFVGGLLVAAAICMLPPGQARATTYKWVDQNGVVHYTDKMPPDAVNRGNVELSRDGVPLRKVDPALTPEQRRAREQDEERRRQTARLAEETARRDRALLASYANEAEIDLARTRALGTIDAVLHSTSAYTEQLNRRKTELVAKIATYKNRPTPPVLERELTGIDDELGRQADLVAQKRREIAAVNAKYDADKTRYRELSLARPETGGLRSTASNADAAAK